MERGWEGIEFEMYNENVMEICEKCLRVRVTLEHWFKPTNELLNIFTVAKQYRVRTLCRDCLKEIFTLQYQKEEVVKMAKLIIKVCKCNNAFHRLEKLWFQLSKTQLENLNLMIKDGKVEVERAICPECKKRRKK